MAQHSEPVTPTDIDSHGLSGSLSDEGNGENQKSSFKVPSKTVWIGIGATLAIIGTLAGIWIWLGKWAIVSLLVLVIAIAATVFVLGRKRDKRLAENKVRKEREAAEAAESERLQALEEARVAAETEEREARHENMVSLRNARRKSMAVFVGNQSGDGSKTTTTAYMALTFRHRLKAVPVIIVECRRDSAQGVDKHRLNNEVVVSIREFHRKLVDGELNNPDGSLNNELIMEQLVSSASGIYYLQADIVAPENDSFGGEEAAEVVKALKTTGAIVLVDSGNDPTDEIVIGMADECTLGVFPTMPTAKSFTMWRRTLDTFSLHVSSDIVKYCVSVLSAVEDGQDFDVLKSKMGALPGDGSFYHTRFDAYMKDDVVSTEENDGTKVADLTKIMPENRDTFEQICERLLEMFVMQGAGSIRRPTPLRTAQSDHS